MQQLVVPENCQNYEKVAASIQLADNGREGYECWTGIETIEGVTWVLCVPNCLIMMSLHKPLPLKMGITNTIQHILFS